MNKIAVVPAYEPDDKMLTLLKELKDNSYDIVVVNDGSNNTYDDIFTKSKKYATILKHKTNKGKGAALKTAFSYIKENYKDNYYVVTVDCDGQHKVSDANKLINYLINHDSILVLGKRIRSGKTPLRSKIGNSITKLIYTLITKVNVYDTQTGLRTFSDKLMDYMLSINGERYEYEMNMLLMCPKNNIKIKEIEIETIYFNNNLNTHFRTIKDSYIIYKDILKFSLSSFISFLIDYTLYILFNLFLSLSLSNILARIISSFINYNLNKDLVFKKKNKTSIIKYYLLVIIILGLNTIILNLLVNNLSINKFISKLLVELVMFIFSYIIQKKYVFKK